jgi:thiol-disulfide isomerase/thioredoxin
MSTMPKWLLAVPLGLLMACAATPPHAPTASLEDTLQADLFPSGTVDLNQDLAAGRPVALVFWQSWCGSCVAEAPAVQAAHSSLGDRIHIIGVVSGPDEAVDEAKLFGKINELGLTYDQIRDRDLTLTRRFGITGTPTIVILDPTGKVVFDEHHVPSSWDDFL